MRRTRGEQGLLLLPAARRCSPQVQHLQGSGTHYLCRESFLPPSTPTKFTTRSCLRSRSTPTVVTEDRRQK